MRWSKVILLVCMVFFADIIFAYTPFKPWPLPMDSADNGVDSIGYSVALSATASSGKNAPFWFYANRNGKFSPAPYAGSLSLSIEKPAARPARWWDYSFSVALTGGVDGVKTFDSIADIDDNLKSLINPSGYPFNKKKSQKWRYSIDELYAHVRLWCFDISAGFKRFYFGNSYNTHLESEVPLSSGAMLWSQNAAPLPIISVGIDKFTAIPFTYGYAEVKGALIHGWFIDGVGTRRTLLHYKYIAGRLGGKLPVNINYEFHHAAQWGGYSDEYGELGSSLYDWWLVFGAHEGDNIYNEKYNALGNHIGSQNIGLELKLKHWHVNAYWQTLFEDGPVLAPWKALNRYDGLWGVQISQDKWSFISSVMYEFLNTTDQSGPTHDIDGVVFGGSDSYFNNSIYPQGWTNRGFVLGIPFIISPVVTNSERVIYNRTMTHNVALNGDIYGFKYLLRYSNSNYYRRELYPTGVLAHNSSFLLAVEKFVPQAWNLNFALSIAADWGDVYGNSFGALFTISRSGLIYKRR